MNFDITDRLQHEQALLRDEQQRINARLDALCTQMNSFCAEVRDKLTALGFITNKETETK